VSEVLFNGDEWSYDTIQRIHDAVAEIAIGELGLDIYPNQIEIITAEQMLDAYASTGMPIFYQHWSFGKHFTQHETMYRKGMMGLAYEIVINSNPCISYVMEGNSATMQTLVIAHAAFGHNHFFKNNQTFRDFTDPAGILDYLKFAKAYISRCEEQYGETAVERLLDAAHALQGQGVHRSGKRRQLDLRTEEARQRDRRAYEAEIHNELWRTLPTTPGKQRTADEARTLAMASRLGLPEENVLFFLERHAPKLASWQREILRIVRLVGHYLYPQRLTKVMNEGTATYVHYRVMQRLHETGKINDGAFFEFLTSHTNVVAQPGFDHPAYSGINPYALGFSMMRDIERIVTKPTDEDRAWAPDIAGRNDVMGVLKEIWENYRDDSFIAQYLSPRLMREMKFFNIEDNPREPELVVGAIHDERGYRKLRRALARRYDPSESDPLMEVASVDLLGDRRLILDHKVLEGRTLSASASRRALQHIADLWGYDVELRELDNSTGQKLAEHQARPQHPFGAG
jgi:stage V sporulation protein R